MDTRVMGKATEGPCEGQVIEFPTTDNVLPVIRYADGRVEILRGVGQKRAVTLGQYRYEDGRAIWEPAA